MNIVMCGKVFKENPYIMEYYAVALYSILENNKGQKINFYYPCADWETTETLEKICSHFGAKFFRISVSEKDLEVFIHPIIVKYITVETYIRVLLPNLVDADKVIYMDADILVNKNLSGLWNFDMEGNMLAMSKIIDDRFSNEPPIGVQYQAGVILMDLKKMRKFNFTEKCIQYVREKIETCGGIQENDQTTICDVAEGRIKEFPWKYNFHAWLLGRIYPSDDRILFIENERYMNRRIGKDLYSDIVLTHYAGPLKSWDNPKSQYFKYKERMVSYDLL